MRAGRLPVSGYRWLRHASLIFFLLMTATIFAIVAILWLGFRHDPEATALGSVLLSAIGAIIATGFGMCSLVLGFVSLSGGRTALIWLVPTVLLVALFGIALLLLRVGYLLEQGLSL